MKEQEQHEMNKEHKIQQGTWLNMIESFRSLSPDVHKAVAIQHLRSRSGHPCKAGDDAAKDTIAVADAVVKPSESVAEEAENAKHTYEELDKNDFASYADQKRESLGDKAKMRLWSRRCDQKQKVYQKSVSAIPVRQYSNTWY